MFRNVNAHFGKICKIFRDFQYHSIDVGIVLQFQRILGIERK